MSDLRTDESTAQLIARLGQESSQLVSAELRLARAEIARSVRFAGFGAGALGASALVAVLGLGALVATAIIALALVLPAWAAGLIVTGTLFFLAGLLAVIGRGQVRQAAPPTPDRAVESVKKDVETVREAGSREH